MNSHLEPLISTTDERPQIQRWYVMYSALSKHGGQPANYPARKFGEFERWLLCLDLDHRRSVLERLSIDYANLQNDRAVDAAPIVARYLNIESDKAPPDTQR